jgi:hypothetical protein
MTKRKPSPSDDEGILDDVETVQTVAIVAAILRAGSVVDSSECVNVAFRLVEEVETKVAAEAADE